MELHLRLAPTIGTRLKPVYRLGRNPKIKSRSFALALTDKICNTFSFEIMSRKCMRKELFSIINKFDPFGKDYSTSYGSRNRLERKIVELQHEARIYMLPELH